MMPLGAKTREIGQKTRQSTLRGFVATVYSLAMNEPQRVKLVTRAMIDLFWKKEAENGEAKIISDRSSDAFSSRKTHVEEQIKDDFPSTNLKRGSPTQASDWTIHVPSPTKQKDSERSENGVDRDGSP